MKRWIPIMAAGIGALAGSAGTFAVKFASMEAETVAEGVVWYCSISADVRSDMRSRLNAILVEYGYSAQINC